MTNEIGWAFLSEFELKEELAGFRDGMTGSTFGSFYHRACFHDYEDEYSPDKKFIIAIQADDVFVEWLEGLNSAFKHIRFDIIQTYFISIEESYHHWHTTSYTLYNEKGDHTIGDYLYLVSIETDSSYNELPTYLVKYMMAMILRLFHKLENYTRMCHINPDEEVIDYVVRMNAYFNKNQDNVNRFHLPSELPITKEDVLYFDDVDLMNRLFSEPIEIKSAATYRWHTTTIIDLYRSISQTSVFEYLKETCNG